MKNSAKEYFDGIFDKMINRFKKNGDIQSQINILVVDKTNEKRILTYEYNTIGNSKDDELSINARVECFIEKAKECYEELLGVIMVEYSIEDDGKESIFYHRRGDDKMVIKVLNVVRKDTHIDENGKISFGNIELVEEDMSEDF